MSNRGFSGTTVAIIALLLIALFGIGHIPGVNPPPAQPPAPAPPPPTPTANAPVPANIKNKISMMAEKQKEMVQMKQQMLKTHPGLKTPLPKDPNTIEANGTHFLTMPDGSVGIQKTQEVVAKEEAEFKRQSAERQAYLKSHPDAVPPQNHGMPD